ncbi:helix-turn-helix transcriptional regulator [Cohnella thailandensis]|nr:AraC family transcriptional regulator [Cohnella thailandensis]MBP1976765.1 AraC-like DNA-binding protein [Cohnella thailandensis]
MRENMREEHNEYLEIYFFTPTEFEKSGAAWPIRLGSNIAKPNYHIGPRISPYYYLLFVLDGEGTFIQGNRTYPLRKNDIFCLFPQVTHEYFTVPDAPLRKAFFAFDGKQALGLLERVGLKPHSPHAAGALTEEAIARMREFFDLATHSDRANTDLARLSAFYRVFDALARRPGIIGAADPGPSADWLQKGLEYLEIHYAGGISIERAAEFVGVERTHFTKTFRKAYGMPPMKYVQQLKMTEAKLLLDQTNYTLSEIALSVGYPDLFSFSKAFKKQEGLSPTQYRNRKKIQLPGSGS